MFEKIRKMKNQKGFTLVELIVVLVILAILAAMLVPALTGYIDKANNEKIIATTRQVVMAAQTEVSEAYASKTLKDASVITIDSAAATNPGVPTYAGCAETDVDGCKIVELAEVATVASKKCTFKNGITKIVIKFDAKGHVNQVELTQGKKVCTYAETDTYKPTGDVKYTSGNYYVTAAA